MATVAHLMTPDVPHLSGHCTLEDATRTMDQARLDALPLCEADGTLLGVVARHNISRAFRSLGELSHSLRAQHLMDPEAPSINLHDAVEKAMAQMAIHQTRYLPVLDGSRVCGMLTSAQIGHERPAVNVEELVDHVKLPAEDAPSSRAQ
ncbi:CBS domain-containing protein [Nesterenkonia halotolerans]|uniref:CBS domain-containing protein n=1 Tax=Nesterenkonia halotolerans TaxID=225325 RepID=A0ABR9J5Z2_9MICC|nr:CBS domain-containing protein [Nesterenkonia halotolerans]MBE1514414.1 CBS domain-containing protein [Nesterenkonia halotolerans]